MASAKPAKASAVPRLPKKMPNWMTPLCKFVIHKKRGDQRVKSAVKTCFDLIQEHWDEYHERVQAQLPKREKKAADPIKSLTNAFRKVEAGAVAAVHSDAARQEFTAQLGSAVPPSLKPFLVDAVVANGAGGAAAAVAAEVVLCSSKSSGPSN